MDNEKFKKILEIVVRVAGAAVLIYFLYNIILTQHEYFSWTKKIPSGERLTVGRNVGGLFFTEKQKPQGKPAAEVFGGSGEIRTHERG